MRNDIQELRAGGGYSAYRSNLLAEDISLKEENASINPAVIDFFLALLGLFLLFPLLLIVAVAVRLDSPGPILFRQTRTGLNGKPFKIYKYRTMTTLEDGAFIQQASPGDKRVTKIGRILRQTSIDELPQLLNVLRGEMSLVGPRPHALAHDEFYSREIFSYSNRFKIKPGITGWAQVNGLRGATPTPDDMRKRVEFDLWYAHNRSLRLYFWILVRTIFQEVSRKTGAY